MANKWHSIDRRIYGEGTGPAHFAEAAHPHQAEQIVREHNERGIQWEALDELIVDIHLYYGKHFRGADWDRETHKRSIHVEVVKELARAALSTQGQKEG